jgi:outer membrane protein OmpA-like peptidoglycan-associated protein
MSSLKQLVTRALGAASVLVLVAGPAAAGGASVDGVRGLLRVHSADPATPGFISGNVYGLYAREWYPGYLSPRLQNEQVDFGAAMVSFGYSPTPQVELSLRGAVEGQWVEATSDNASEIGTGDVAFTLKTLLTPASRPDWMLGAELMVAGPTGNENALVGTWDRDGVDVGGRLNLTYANLGPMGDTNLRMHVNAGYLKRTSEFDDLAWAVTSTGGTEPRAVLHGDQFLYGAAVEVPAPQGWTFFAEWTGEYDMDAEASFTDNPMRVTPGLRWSTRSGSFGWTAGYELNVASDEASPDWQWVSGFTFGGYTAPQTGGLLGVVRDEATGDPIPGAEVKVRNAGEPAVHTDANGRFTTKVPQGYAVVELQAEGYNAKTRVVEMPAHKSVEFDFTMAKRNVFGSLKGRIRDAETGNPLFARVRVAGGNEWVETDPETGTYTIETVQEGEAAVEVEALNYQPSSNSVRVTAGEPAALDVSLLRDLNARMGIVSGYVRAQSTGEPLPATVTARGKRTLTATVDPETGLYELQLEEGTWSLSAAGRGYVAQVDTVAIAPQGASVRNFDLEVLPQQITLKGVYFDSGAATIKRESFTALEKAAKFLLDNRDIQVVIEGHTDSMGAADANQALSQRRADSVMKFLVVNYGVDPQRLAAKGLGPDEPIASNNTAEGRALNRRIEFQITESPEGSAR